ncbi:MAG: tetratricopeptide repeat protein [Candidatus Heimdallarchaeota archaeon]
MKRYRRNQIYRYLNREKFFLISSAIFISSLLMAILISEYDLTEILTLLVFIIIFSGFYTLYRIFGKNRWINYLLNVKRIRKNIKKYENSKEYEKYAISLIEMGTLYGVLKNFTKELDYYLKAYQILEDINHDKLRSVICQPIAFIYEKQKNYSNTETFLLRGLEFSKVVNEHTLIREYLTRLGEFYEKRGDLNKAADYFSKASSIR